MTKTKLILMSLLCLCMVSCGRTYKWETVPMDGSRTGCTAASAENVDTALGTIAEDGTYTSPSGNVFAPETATAKVAAAVLAVQPRMASVKKVIAQSEESMPNGGSENKLSNWFVGIIMDKVQDLSGKKVDVGVGNFGGIRIGMPKGDVTLDDMKSMFPFKNYVVYLELSGAELRKVFEKMAAERFQALGGVYIEVENKQIVTAQIGGAPIDDEKMYGVATISFLLYGGDGLSLADNAQNLQQYEVSIFDAVMDHINALNARGEKIKGSDVKHVIVR